MPRKEILDRIQKYVHPFRITKGKGFRLKDFDPGDTCGLKLDKGDAADLLQQAGGDLPSIALRAARQLFSGASPSEATARTEN